MNASEMSAAQRVWWLIVMPALAGIGLFTVLGWLPDPWLPWVLAALCLAGLVWTVREVRWARRTRRELERDIERWQ